jgi:hypothetical protein
VYLLPDDVAVSDVDARRVDPNDSRPALKDGQFETQAFEEDNRARNDRHAGLGFIVSEVVVFVTVVHDVDFQFLVDPSDSFDALVMASIYGRKSFGGVSGLWLMRGTRSSQLRVAQGKQWTTVDFESFPPPSCIRMCVRTTSCCPYLQTVMYSQ